MRRVSIFISIVALLTLNVCAGTVQAAVIYDDFEGSSIDTTKWDLSFTGSGSAVVEDSLLKFISPDVASGGVAAGKADFGYDTYSFKIGNYTGDQAIIFGLLGSGKQLNIRADFGIGWVLYANDGVNPGYISSAFTAPVAGDVYSIVWSSDSVEVLRNGKSILTETSVIPAGTMNLYLNKYAAGTAEFDSVSIGAVPEPSTLALLATGLIGLLASAWRKR